MKHIELTTTLERTAKEVFDFTLDPNNTPKWIEGIVKEIASETPTRKGTIYRSQGRDGT